MEYKHNPIKAIREKCLDCCGGSTLEVKNCTCENCHLFPFRLGKNPFRKREMTEEQRKAVGDRLREARKTGSDNEDDKEDEE